MLQSNLPKYLIAYRSIWHLGISTIVREYRHLPLQLNEVKFILHTIQVCNMTGRDEKFWPWDVSIK